MTLEEYDTRLRELTDEEFQKFNNDFGGGQITVEQSVREFVDDPKHERRICRLREFGIRGTEYIIEGRRAGRS